MLEPYYYSPFGFKKMWQAELPVLIFFLFLLVLFGLDVSKTILVFFAIIFFAILLIIIPFFMKRPTPFDRTHIFESEFDIKGINRFIRTPVGLRANKDGIVFQVIFDCFMVPYNRIVSGPSEVGWIVKSVRIIVDVPGVPRKLTIHADKAARKALMAFLRSRVPAADE